MENYDPKTAAQVWQRVLGTDPAPPPQTDLTSLIAGEMADEAAYLTLSRKLRGQQSDLLRQMARQAQTHSACLRGIHRLRTGTAPQVRVPEPSDAPPEQLLRRCYSRKTQNAAQYEARSSDREFGEVFAGLARQEREHCRIILELLGNLQPITPGRMR